MRGVGNATGRGRMGGGGRPTSKATGLVLLGALAGWAGAGVSHAEEFNIGDLKVTRLIGRFLKAGVLSNGFMKTSVADRHPSLLNERLSSELSLKCVVITINLISLLRVAVFC